MKIGRVKYVHPSAPPCRAATTSVDGHMTNVFATKLDGLEKQIVIDGTATDFRTNAATGTMTNPQYINDNNTNTAALAYNIGEYAEIDLKKIRHLNTYRQHGSLANAGNGRWKLQYFNWLTHAWVDWVTNIPIRTTFDWSAPVSVTAVITSKIRLVCTTVDTNDARSTIVDLEVYYS